MRYIIFEMYLIGNIIQVMGIHRFTNKSVVQDQTLPKNVALNQHNISKIWLDRMGE